jgi:hypothetical protein
MPMWNSFPASGQIYSTGPRFLPLMLQKWLDFLVQVLRVYFAAAKMSTTFWRELFGGNFLAGTAEPGV